MNQWWKFVLIVIGIGGVGAFLFAFKMLKMSLQQRLPNERREWWQHWFW